MNVSQFSAGKLQFVGTGLLFGIYLVWQIPNVIVIRHMVLLGLCLLFLPAGVRGIYGALTARAGQPGPKAVLIAYALYLSWLLIVAVGISAELGESLSELKGQWLPPTLYLLIGYGAALTHSARQPSEPSPVRIAFWGLVAHAGLQFSVAAWTIYHEGRFPSGNFGGISDHKANVTYTNVLALALLLTEIAFSAVEVRLLGLGRRVQAITFALLLLSTYVSATRNGVIVFLLLTAIGAIAFGLRYRRQAPRRWWSILAACVVVMILGAWVALNSDSRWERFTATVPVAWDIDGSYAWVDLKKYPVPLAADGEPVDLSAYQRIAFVHAALRFLAQNPLGTEVSRDAFKKLVSVSYAPTVEGHPHNSYLDLGISVGLPGLAFWLAFLGTMIWFGWRSFRRWKNPAGIALLMVVLGFALRSLLDSIVRDHIIQEFMLTCGLLLGCIEASHSDKGPIASR